MDNDITPIRQQYLDIKKKYPNAILFFRLGDFYETFDQDAETTSKELDIVLTSRNIAKGLKVPMAGIPYHAVENYLARLIEKGYHVAICEQVGEQPQRGLFPREVVQVITPGTVVAPGLLKADQNNYLCSFYIEDHHCGLAYVDISTGEFATTEIEGADLPSLLRDEILRLKPSEILFPDSNDPPAAVAAHFTPWPAWHFELRQCRETLQTHLQVASLDGFGLRESPCAIRASGAIIQYLKETQPGALKLLNTLSTYHTDEFMSLDAATLRNLELTETIRHGNVKGSLLSVLDHTVTAMGKRLIRQWVSKPLLDLETINTRQESVNFLVENGYLRAELRSTLKSLGDLERLTNRVSSGNALPRDLIAIRASLENLPAILETFHEKPACLLEVLTNIQPCQEELLLLQQSISDDPPATLQNVGIIRPGFSDELDQLITSTQHARDWISNLEAIERERTGIKTLKVGYNKVFGYFIEVTHSNTVLIPDNYIRKQTLVNAERYITPEMKEYETLVLNAEERIHEVEIRAFRQICSQLASQATKLLKTARNIAHLDALTSLAESAAIHGYIRPEVCADTVLEIYDGRHPVVERSISGERFVPNDTIFESGEVVRIITGPNMSGKSTFLRQTALIVLMAQMGSFVPASSARIGKVDRIFTRIGAQDEIHAGQSTFMVEMIEAANILNHATHQSLLILDEIGRGTSTYDGVSIAWAVVEYIHNHPKLRARTLFATHYHELTQLAQLLPGVRNFNVAVSEADEKVVFLHKIIPGGADRSYGIHVAQLAGLPRPVIQRALEILKQLESSSGKAAQLDIGSAQQLVLFPETNPFLEELKLLDINSLTPIEAINKLYDWKRKFLD